MRTVNALPSWGITAQERAPLLKCIDRICPTRDGSVLVDGKDVFTMTGREMARHIAYVPQNARPVDMTVFDAVLLGRKPYIKWDITREDREIVSDVLHQMGLDGYAMRNASELSGGEVQKVMLARALAQSPNSSFWMNPPAILTPRSQHEVLNEVRRIARENHISVAIIIHDLNLAVRYCDRFLFLKDAAVYAYGGMEVMSPENIEAVYGMRAQVLQLGRSPVVVPFPKETAGVNGPAENEHGDATREMPVLWKAERRIGLSAV